ncbi:hypothetical protein JCM11641_004577 [Rhodosporidiobolus odoratus]
MLHHYLDTDGKVLGSSRFSTLTTFGTSPINLRAIKRIMENDGMDLSVIVNHKVSDKGEAVIQLETAVGDSIKHFKGAHGINVPRSRFLPVKSCSDLLLLMSNMYRLEHVRRLSSALIGAE